MPPVDGALPDRRSSPACRPARQVAAPTDPTAWRLRRAGPVMADAPVAPTSSPSALQAALTAFDSRRNGHDSLPDPRPQRDEPAAPGTFEEPASITQSRLDPEAAP